MQLTTKGRYAVMAMYRLYSQLSHQQVVPISYISETEGISVTYLEHLFVKLRKAGLVNAVRGMNGGYALAKDAKEIYLSDIILASEENLRFTRCSPLAHRHCTKTKAVCTTHRLWEALSDHVFYFLRHTSLADLASTRFPAIIRTPCNDTVETRSNQFIYLDYNATAPLLPQVKTSMVEILDLDGNPSSVHGLGRALRAKIDKARKQVAAAVGALPAQVTFTSGGTEANYLALSGLGLPKETIYASAVEHASVYQNIVSDNLIPVDAKGQIQLDVLESFFKRPNPPKLVSVAYANSETGIIQQSLHAIIDLCHQYGCLVHTDAVQAFGKVPLSFIDLGADLMTISAHKIGGPKGVGALISQSNIILKAPYLGGGQEKGLRSGTENIPAIVGFGVAADHAVQLDWMPIQTMLQKVATEMTLFYPDVVLNSSCDGLPNTLNVSTPGYNKDTQVIHFDLQGIAISAGSACSSGKVERSHVLNAMGLEDAVINSAIRLSLSPNTTLTEMEQFIAAWKTMLGINQSKQYKEG